MSPMTTPATRCASSLSSPAAAITSTVNSGVVAFRIEANPLETSVCPVTISENGSTLLSSAMAKKGFQPATVRGNRILYAHSTGRRIRAASATRSSTTVSGGSSRSTMPLKKNEPPHSTESTASSDQSLMSMRWSVASWRWVPA